MSGQISITPLGGVGEVGRNCFLYVFDSDKGKRSFIIDAGTRIVREENRHQDPIIEPDFELLTDIISKDNAKCVGAFITHGHLDHMNSVDRVNKELGIKVFASKTAQEFLKSQYYNQARIDVEKIHSEVAARLKSGKSYPEKDEDRKFLKREREIYVRDYLLPKNLLYKDDKRYLYDLRKGRRYDLGGLLLTVVEFLHSTPETFGFLLEGCGKRILHMPDCKLNGFNPQARAKFEAELAETVTRGAIDAVIMESLGASTPGESEFEIDVIASLKKLIAEKLNLGKRVIITTLSSHIKRLQEIDKAIRDLTSEPPAYVGASLHNGARIAGLYNKTRPQEARVLLVTGSQAESEEGRKSILMRMLDDPRSERDLVFTNNDSVIVSFRVIPGNELAVSGMLWRILREDVEVVLNLGEIKRLGLDKFGFPNVSEALTHTTGHGYAEEKRRMLEILKPKVVIPYHAEEADVVALEGLLPSSGSRMVRVGNGVTYTF